MTEDNTVANAEQQEPHKCELAAFHEELGNLARICDQWTERRDSQRRRGLNDLNLFTLLRKAHEEVGLYSRFIAYLPAPDADHGQGDLFLEQFMAECGHAGILNTKQAIVRREYNHVDICITDGDKHVMIENQVYVDILPL